MKKKKKILFKKIAKLSVKRDFVKLMNENKNIIMTFEGKSVYPSAIVDKDSYYRRIETGYLISPDKKRELIQELNNRTFIQFKDQASANLRVR